VIDILKSCVIGAATSILTWAVAGLLLVALATVNGAQSHALRRAIAIAGLAVVTSGGAFVLAKAPFALGPRFRANPWLALVIAGLLTGLIGHWLLLYISIVNDCAAEVSVPYNWIHTCSRSQ
jgi:hypothetical protein